MQVSGQVSAVTARETSAGTFYDVVVNGKKYGHGKFAPRGIQQGDFVTFEVDVKQNGQYTNYNIRAKTLRKDEGGASAAPVPQASGQAGTAKGQFNTFDSRQETISKQAALNTALSFANFAASQGAVPMPKSAKEADKLGLLQAWVLEQAGMFYNLSTGNTWDMPEVADPKPIPKPPAKAKPKAEEDDTPFPDTDQGYDEY